MATKSTLETPTKDPGPLYITLAFPVVLANLNDPPRRFQKILSHDVGLKFK